MLWTIIVILVILMLLGAGPGYRLGYGYYPSGIIGVILLIVIILLLTGHRF